MYIASNPEHRDTLQLCDVSIPPFTMPPLGRGTSNGRRHTCLHLGRDHHLQCNYRLQGKAAREYASTPVSAPPRPTPSIGGPLLSWRRVLASSRTLLGGSPTWRGNKDCSGDSGEQAIAQDLRGKMAVRFCYDYGNRQSG